MDLIQSGLRSCCSFTGAKPWPIFTCLLWEQTPNQHTLGTNSSTLAQVPGHLQRGCEKWNRTSLASQFSLVGACRDTWPCASGWNNYHPALVMGQGCCKAALISA